MLFYCHRTFHCQKFNIWGHMKTYGDIGSDSINAIDCHWVTPQSWDATIVVIYVQHVVT